MVLRRNGGLTWLKRKAFEEGDTPYYTRMTKGGKETNCIYFEFHQKDELTKNRKVQSHLWLHTPSARTPRKGKNLQLS